MCREREGAEHEKHAQAGMFLVFLKRKCSAGWGGMVVEKDGGDGKGWWWWVLFHVGVVS